MASMPTRIYLQRKLSPLTIDLSLPLGAKIIWRAGPDAKPIARAALCAAPVAPLARIHLDRGLDTRLWHRRHDCHLLYRGRRPLATLAVPRSVQADGAGGYR